MKLVYIAGPYTDKNRWEQEQNVRAAEDVALMVAEMGLVPVCPHTMYRHFDGTLKDDYWYRATLELMKRCDAVCLVAGWEASKGAVREVEEAERLGMPICETIGELEGMRRWWS